MKRWNLLLLSLGLALVACGPKKDLPTLAVDDAPADEILVAAQERRVPTAVRGSFGFAADLPDTMIPGVLTGNLVVQQPGQFRLDVLPPVGGQVLVGASNGEHLHLLLPLDHEWWGADDVETILREATASAVGIEDFTELLVGQLPQLDGLDPEIIAEGEVGPVVRYSGPEGVQVDVELDRAGYLWRSIEARDGTGQVLLLTASEGVIYNEGSWYPSKMVITLPTLDIVLKLRYRSWETAVDPGEIFYITVPEGYLTVDMMAKLDDAIEEQAATQDPSVEGEPGEAPPVEETEEEITPETTGEAEEVRAD